MRSFKKAIARYIPMMGWMAQITENAKELEVLLIKDSNKYKLKEGMKIDGDEVDGLFKISS